MNSPLLILEENNMEANEIYENITEILRNWFTKDTEKSSYTLVYYNDIKYMQLLSDDMPEEVADCNGDYVICNYNKVNWTDAQKIIKKLRQLLNSNKNFSFWQYIAVTVEIEL